MLLAIPTYTISIFRVLENVCEEMDKTGRNFWWGVALDKLRFLALKKWSHIC